MKHIPILFSTPMVQAILKDRKSQTRRIIDPQPDKEATEIVRSSQWKNYPWCARFEYLKCKGAYEATNLYKDKYGVLGDILWVRETWHPTRTSMPTGLPYEYKATAKEDGNPTDEPWRPSIFMPKEACRLFLKIETVRVERLQDITEKDAIAEGIESFRPVPGDGPAQTLYKHYFKDKWGPSPVHSYQTLWIKINGHESWLANPWVWVITFHQVERPSDFLPSTDALQCVSKTTKP